MKPAPPVIRTLCIRAPSMDRHAPMVASAFTHNRVQKARSASSAGVPIDLIHHDFCEYRRRVARSRAPRLQSAVCRRETSMIRFGLLGCGRIAKRHSDLLGGNLIEG